MPIVRSDYLDSARALPPSLVVCLSHRMRRRLHRTAQRKAQSEQANLPLFIEEFAWDQPDIID